MAKRKTTRTANREQPPTNHAGLAVKIGGLVIALALVAYLFSASIVGEQGGTAPDTQEAIATSVTDAGTRAADPQPVAPVTVSPPSIELGEVRQNVVVTREVTLTNTGSAPIRILDTRPSCPCTTVKRHHNVIDPGRSITMEIETDSQARVGPKSVVVNVILAGYQGLRIPIQATVLDDAT